MTQPISIMPCMDMQDGRVVKGVHFVDIKDAGDPVQCAEAYCKAGADELGALGLVDTEVGITEAGIGVVGPQPGIARAACHGAAYRTRDAVAPVARRLRHRGDGHRRYRQCDDESLLDLS